jgi:DNA (cytosine-5)-methyltransferase 1
MIKAIDFFCGAGGLTRGLLDAGISVVAGIDNDNRIRKTYESNNRPSRFIAADVRKVNIGALREELDVSPKDPTLYAACTPCQPFSTLNTMRAADGRKSLLLDFAAIVDQAPPDFIIVENVPGLGSSVGKEIYKEFEKILERHGFQFDAKMLDAKDFGVPQTRKRFLLVASRHGRPFLPPPTSKERFKTVGDAIRRFPAIAHGERSDSHKNHVAREMLPHHLRIVEAVPVNGGSRRDVADTSLLLKCHQKNPKAHKDVFGRMSWDLPAPTLTCRCTDVYCGRFIHPEQHRGISLREAAALQTFGDRYEFFGGSILELARQIGNAVPVRLAKLLGDSIVQAQAGQSSS